MGMMLRAFFFCLSFLLASSNAESSDNGVYIVYMGASPPSSDHAQILSSLITRRKNAVVQTYSNGFSGFAARLSEEEAKSIARKPGVVSVFPDPLLQLHTTRSWDFLKFQTHLKIDSNPSSSSGTDTIIGILDTGIWPESESFIDTDMGPIPPHWNGTCMAGLNFTTSNCNRKLIGARYYDDGGNGGERPFGTPRDMMGHGTHVSSTAGGRAVSGASYYGLATGAAVGGSPGSRIAMYRVCGDGGCRGSAIMKGFDDAIGDGVDVLSLSLGSNPGEAGFDTDPIAIGAFHAVEKGIIVACSAGNSGPFPSTVVNVAPWILTVAATTIDRDFEVKVILGGTNKIIKGGGINFSSLNKSSVYPLTDGLSAKSSSDQYDDVEARNCAPGSLDDAKVKGKIVLCENEDEEYQPREKFELLENQGAIGLVLVDNNARQLASKSPVVAYFSSRGPTLGIPNLLKPDIAAPGVSILAAWPSNDRDEALPGKAPPLFDILSGTSMACPHVSALAALVKSQHPNWSPSAIRSSIMTTAIQTNNLNAPITTNQGSAATPYDIGAGEMSLSGPLEPGLVYETQPLDYINFLCNFGYDAAMIRRIASTLPSNFSCSGGDPSSELISDMNYPSIAVSGLKASVIKVVNRTVTNVGEEESTYSSLVEAPATLQVQVVPNKLQFTKNVKTLSFQVRFELAAESKNDLFGSITWSNEKYKVRSPFVVSNNA
ncbi:Subtilisin-like serine endopeptidase family protein [Perilla frutescens var. hirtella]|uniref:Subtilisin-like serine endopeptidase family protein n=1 Tax=Perilla frutescens var. hirtella TaxID=608512 RepID=A0AAD4JGX0_PERFH|nr:Subtilisin-like serine endopeptidase family protein [Perilla frutescens var. hirtella]